MPTIYLPAGMTHVPCDDVALKIADALWPDDGIDDEAWSFNHARCWIVSEQEIERAVCDGTLPLKDPSTRGPLTFLRGNAWKFGEVTIDDLRAYVADRGIIVVVGPAPEQTDTQPPGVTLKAAESQPDSITSRQVATVFDGLPYTAENWPKRLSDTKWLQPAKIALGEVGGITGLWCPLILARLIHGREKGLKQKTFEALNSRFKRNPALQPWRDAWNEHYALFTDANDG